MAGELYQKGLGNALGEALGQGAQTFVQKQDQYDEKRYQRDQTAMQQGKQDASNAYNYLSELEKNFTDMQVKGGLEKLDPLAKAQAQESLNSIQKLKGKLAKGDYSALGEMGALQKSIEDLTGVTNQGSQYLGSLAVKSTTLDQALTQQQIDSAKVDDMVKQWGMEAEKAKLPLTLATMAFGLQMDRQTYDQRAKMNPLDLEKAQIDINAARHELETNTELDPLKKRLLQAQLDQQEVQVKIAQATAAGEIDGKNADNWSKLAEVGDTSHFDQMVKDGLMSQPEANLWIAYSKSFKDKRDAELQQTLAQIENLKAGTAATTQDTTFKAQLQPGALKYQSLVNSGTDLDNQQKYQDLQFGSQANPLKLAGMVAGNRLTDAQATGQEQNNVYDLSTQDARSRQLQLQNENLFNQNKSTELGIRYDRMSLEDRVKEQGYKTQLAGSQAAVAAGTVDSTIREAGANADTAVAGAQVAMGSVKSLIDKNFWDMVGSKEQAFLTRYQQQLAGKSIPDQLKILANNARQSGSEADIASYNAIFEKASLQDKIESSSVNLATAKANYTSVFANAQVDKGSVWAKIKAFNLQNDLSGAQLKQYHQTLLNMEQEYWHNGAKNPLELQQIRAAIKLTEAQALAQAGKTPADSGERLQTLKALSVQYRSDRDAHQKQFSTLFQKYATQAGISVDQFDISTYETHASEIKDPAQRKELDELKGTLELDDANNKQVSDMLQQLATGKPLPGTDSGTDSGGGKVNMQGGASVGPSGLPSAEISKQVDLVFTSPYGLLAKLPKGGSKAVKDWFADDGPVRAYNGMGKDEKGNWTNPSYVTDIKATTAAKPWTQAIQQATGPRKAELLQIDKELTAKAAKYGIPADIVKAMVWKESAGWQPGINSSDGKGGGLGQTTGYFVPGAPERGSRQQPLGQPVTATKTTPAPTGTQTNAAAPAGKGNYRSTGGSVYSSPMLQPGQWQALDKTNFFKNAGSIQSPEQARNYVIMYAKNLFGPNPSNDQLNELLRLAEEAHGNAVK